MIEGVKCGTDVEGQQDRLLHLAKIASELSHLFDGLPYRFLIRLRGTSSPLEDADDAIAKLIGKTVRVCARCCKNRRLLDLGTE